MERTILGLSLCVVSRLVVGEELICAGESAGIEGTLQGVQSSGEDEPRRVEGTVSSQRGASVPSPTHFAAGSRVSVLGSLCLSPARPHQPSSSCRRPSLFSVWLSGRDDLEVMLCTNTAL